MSMKKCENYQKADYSGNPSISLELKGTHQKAEAGRPAPDGAI